MSKKSEAILIHIIIYGSAIAASYGIFSFISNDSQSYFTNLFLSNLIGCLIIYINCIVFDSFSINDPNWTIQTFIYSLYHQNQTKIYTTRAFLVLFLVSIWCIRLTYNLYSTAVEHISHEDWRFSDLRLKWRPKLVYFIFGFFGIILIPYVITFFGCLPLYYVFTSSKPLNYMDIFAYLTLSSGILIESIADYQLSNEFKKAEKEKRIRLMDKGLWSQCRHPNYFGEILFWFGMFLFGWSSGASFNDTTNLIAFILGPFGVFFLIYFISLPLMEERQLMRKKELYREYIKKVPFKILPINFISKKIQNLIN
ncbi:unnamed protein product [Brachionus calyciflorus]|uniref:Steroid 5-alpha reductase C-terminal domain-containing protein n=1 Tax=Brachionus calyciflorus TaxID=104777 RepID=A0A813LWG7_9BILA|nr:unnamed protein product [Brachionus calyciflorus]